MNKIKKDLVFLFLCLIIIGSICYHVEKAYALDEFIDDYTNENYIQTRNDVVRNAALDAIELDAINTTFENTPMDIWTTGGFTRVEQGIQHLKNINGTEIWFDNVDRDEGDRIYKDFGANFFTGNWEYHFRVRIASAHTSNARACFMGFSQTSADHYTARVTGADLITFFVQWKQVTGKWDIRLRTINEGAITQDIEDETESFDLDKWYHVNYVRNGDNVTAWFYNDALKTDLDFMLTVVDADITDLRWFHPLNSQNQVTGGRAMDMWLNQVRNMTTGINYLNNGYFYTTEVLTALSGNSIVLLTNSTIPYNDIITVEFSDDNLTWVDHNGIGGSDTLVAGNESIDIRDLSYLILYMRFYFTDIGADSTPRLYQIWVITNDVVSGVAGGVYTGWILGIFILVPSIAILISSRKRGKRK